MLAAGRGRAWHSFRRRWLWWLIAAAVFYWGFDLRLSSLASRSLEYDEVWTFLNYVKPGDIVKIFSDLATPNNHSLNSFLAFISTSWLGASFASLRLPAFLSGVLLMPLAGLLAWRVLRSRAAACLAMAFCAMSGGLLHYSQTARGYSLQSFFVLCSAACLLWPSSERLKLRLALGFAIFSILSILTIPTGVVFAGAIGFMWLVLNFDWRAFASSVKTNWMMLASFVCVGVFSLAWYGANYSQFREGQAFGESITGASAFLSFAYDRLSGAVGAPWLLLVCASLLSRRTRRAGLFVIGVFALSLFSAFAVKAGPLRVYLPLVPFAALGVAAGAQGLFYAFRSAWRRPLAEFLSLACIAPLLLGGSQSLAKCTPPDWPKAFSAFSSEFPPDVYLNYPCSDGYPLAFGNPEGVVRDQADRIANFGSLFASIASDSSINAFSKGGETCIPVPASIRPLRKTVFGLSVELYKLRHIEASSSLPAVSPVVGVAGIGSYERVVAAYELLFNNDDWLPLNIWLKCKFPGSDGTPCGGLTFFAPNCPLTPARMAEIERSTRGFVKFFSLESYEGGAAR